MLRASRWVRGNHWYWILIGIIGSALGVFLILGMRFDAVLSDSMAPGHPAGSVVITVQVPTAQIKPGDIVKLPLPEGNGESYAHRVTDALAGRDGVVVTTKGDNNPREDPWSLEIISPTTPMVIATIPLLGNLTGLTSNFWFQLSLGVVVLAFVNVALIRGLGLQSSKKQASKHDPDESEDQRREP